MKTPNTRIPANSELEAGQALNRLGKDYKRTIRQEVNGQWNGFTYFIDFNDKEIGYYQDDLKVFILFKTPR